MVGGVLRYVFVGVPIPHLVQVLAPGYSPPLVDRIGVYGDIILIYPKPYSIYLRGIVFIGWRMEKIWEFPKIRDPFKGDYKGYVGVILGIWEFPKISGTGSFSILIIPLEWRIKWRRTWNMKWIDRGL